MATETFEEFRVGPVLGRGFSILFRNLASFMAIGLIVMLPMLVFGLWATSMGVQVTESGNTGPPVPETWEFGGLQLASLLLQVLLTNLVTAAVVYGAFQELKGERASFGQCLGVGLSRLLPVVGVAIVAGILVGLGFVAFVVPGVIALVVFYVAIPSAVVENMGVGSSLGRSRALTKGYRWRVLLLLILLAICTMVFYVLVGVVLTFLFAVAFGGGEPFVAAALLEWGISAFVACAAAVMSAVAYHDLRVAKEGIDIHQMAAVFD